MKILLLEDDPLLGESLKEYLELDDWTIDWAQDGNEVLDWTFEKRYDLYILDINVPEISGLELLKELRESGDGTPAIYISALSDIDSISAGFDAGAVDYLKKPFDPEELALRIRHRFGTRNKCTVAIHREYCGTTTRKRQKTFDGCAKEDPAKEYGKVQRDERQTQSRHQICLQ